MMDGVGQVGGGEVEEYIILNLALWAEVQVLEVIFFHTLHDFRNTFKKYVLV